MFAFIRRHWRPILVAFIVLDIALVAGFAIWWTGGSGEPSGPTLAPTLAVPPQSPAPAATPTPAATAAPTPSPAAAAATPAPAPEPTAPVQLTPSTDGQAVLYRFGSGDGQASFAIDEILNNAPFTAVGITDEVAGDLIIDWSNPANSQLGTIVINARTLETDNPFRDRAIRNSVLESGQDEYEFITFAPTQLRGLPASVAVGETVEFEVVGDLTIREITLSTVWAASVTLNSQDQVSASASVEVLRSDFDLQIPSVPRVAGVDDDVLLTIEFSAQKVG
jgi:polyisoprenoid-binding protein YceI